ncbi:hypothetical protein, partial [uncultured Psychroserpens sp.]|uniref:hypothetical protein n=1 Tax=uncultured Psychroserpens sp. TaxID=255436 RepID=UPI002628FE0E
SFSLAQEQEVTYKRLSLSGTQSDIDNTFVEIRGPNSFVYTLDLNTVTEAKFTLDAGAYEIHYITPATNPNVQAEVCIGYKRFTLDVKRYVYGGGVRIKSIKFKNDPNDLSSQYGQKHVLFDYDEEGTQNKSSGAIDGFLTGLTRTHVESVSRHMLPESCPLGVVNTGPVTFQFTVTTKGANVDLTQGQYVGYKRVKAYENLNGYNVYTYSSAQDHYNDVSVFTYPYTPALDLDYKRGLLLNQSVHNQAGDTLKVTINTYDYDEDFITKNYNLYAQDNAWKMYYNSYSAMQNTSPDQPLLMCASGCASDCITTYSSSGVPFYFNSNDIKSTWAKLIKTETKDYFYDGGPADIKESRQEFVYDNTNFQIDSLKLYYNEKGIEQFLLTEYFYPHDNVSSTLASVRTKLDDINKVNEVLETITSKNGVQISQTNTEYHEFATNLILPKLVETKKGTGSIEERIEFYNYDSYGNPLEVGKTDGIKITYVWGFD